ncbi:ISL3 family transposase [Capsulimonas corticalis]|uniref:ISL3 family transposase n=1 Tax=Capsulimonas corticalis TaxID=2219043 RepID=A0A402D4F0_9BACT|nr:ISL3 family transposase [Capsulimonas corticalis]BDI29196.1 ISL3 family transposase [Capsulimonas corticalis]
MSNILGLRDWEVSDADPDIRIENFVTARYTIHPNTCTACGVVDELYKHGTYKLEVRDVPTLGKPTRILITRQRYRCRACRATFAQPMAEIDSSGTMTKRLIAYIQENAIERTFTSVAKDVGVADNTVSGIFDNYITALDKMGTLFQTPEYLGIDEIQIHGKMCCILTNVTERTVYELLPSRKKEDIVPILKSLRLPPMVKCVCIDMWKPYKLAVQEAWGEEIPIVIDHFHVVKLANEAVETMRKSKSSTENKVDRISLKRRHRTLLKRYNDLDREGRTRIAEWKVKYPDLIHVYELKEQFYAIWETTSRVEAEVRYQQWLQSMPKELLPWFKELMRAVDNWHSEVFAYFDHPITNAYTEAMNRIINLMVRYGPANSFETIRGKLRYSKRNLRRLSTYQSHMRYDAIGADKLLPFEVLAKGAYGVSLSGTIESLLSQSSVDTEANPYAEFGFTEAELMDYGRKTEELWDVDMNTILKHSKL